MKWKLLQKKIIPHISAEFETNNAEPICVAWARRVVKKELIEGGDENNPDDFIKKWALLILFESNDDVVYKCIEMIIDDDGIMIDGDGNMVKKVTYGKDIVLTQESLWQKKFSRLYKMWH